MTKELMLRTCEFDMTSYLGFQWPEKGLVEAPDWNPIPCCGDGLHGFLYGQGNGYLANWDEDAKWLVCEIETDEMVDLGNKTKVPKATVIYAGNRETATQMISDRYPTAAVIGGKATAGDKGTATVGDYGTATTGRYGRATAGDKGTAIVGDYGTATTGCNGTAIAGDYGTAITGGFGAAIVGYKGSVMAGIEGMISIYWWDGKINRKRSVTGYIRENGIEPNVLYKCNENGELVKVNN